MEETRSVLTIVPVLCYLDIPWAYFTTLPLTEQSGELWDKPYASYRLPFSPCWHNHPQYRNNPNCQRGYKRGTTTPLEAGELCRCTYCLRDWNEDGSPKYTITKIAFEVFAGFTPRSLENYSIKEINQEKMAYLQIGQTVNICAGITLSEFYRIIKQHGGQIFEEKMIDGDK